MGRTVQLGLHNIHSNSDIINKQRSQSTVEQEDNKKELKEESASQVRYSAHSSRSLGL